MTPHQCKYIAYDLIRKTVDGQDRLSMSLFNAAVDLNPHQIEAALFALQSPLSQGCVLADEVGLGKTIEAGIVLCQYWAERRRKIVIITPASIRKQWALELEEKFDLPAVILDSQSWKEALRNARRPLDQSAIILMSFNFACRVKEELRSLSWDLVVIDEAHKLRNAYRASNKLGQAIRWATEGCRKLLLTATPLQNSLLELYGLSTLIDDKLLGDVNAFRARYLGAEANLKELRSRLHSFCTRTLRKQVLEYINYTERKAITRPFIPSEDEQDLYEAVSAFLRRENSFAIPGNNKQLTQIILRKLLASSSTAIAGTLATMKARLERFRDSRKGVDDEGLGFIFPDEEIEDELLDEILEEPEPITDASPIDRKTLLEEIQELDRLMRCAEGIGVDTKSRSLLSALEIGFSAIETFNYLIGLKVNHISAPHVLMAEFERDSEKRLRVKGRLNSDTTKSTKDTKQVDPVRAFSDVRCSSSWWFRNVAGTLLDGRRVLVIWRKRPGGETPEGLEQDNLVLDEWFKSKQGYSTKDSEFDLIYVNGTNNLENLKTPDELWKVRLIEEDFLRLMFEDTEA